MIRQIHPDYHLRTVKKRHLINGQGKKLEYVGNISYRCNNNQHTQCAKLDCPCGCHNFLIK